MRYSSGQRVQRSPCATLNNFALLAFYFLLNSPVNACTEGCLSLFNRISTLDEDVLQCYSEHAAGGPLSLLMQQLIQLSGDALISTTSIATGTVSGAVSSSGKQSSAEKSRASTPQKPSDFIRGQYYTLSLNMCSCRTKQHLVLCCSV
jgi:hypothetical protein